MSYYNQQQAPPNPGYQGPGFQPQGANPYQPGWNVGSPQGQYPNQAEPSPQYGGHSPHYAEGGVPKNEMGFSDVTIRANFVRKVFIMVTVMLGVVALMSAIPFIHKPTMDFVSHSPGGQGLYFLGYITFLVVYIALMCCEGVRRSYPANIICTSILTLSIGYMTMMITARYEIESVFLCLIITTVCCGGIVIFSSQTKYDLTSLMGYVCIAGLVIMVFGLVAIMAAMFFKIRFLYLVYAGLAALLFMFYLAIDIQMIMGGRKLEISPEEHIFAAIQVFLDIIYIFWMLLSLFGNNN